MIKPFENRDTGYNGVEKYDIHTGTRGVISLKNLIDAVMESSLNSMA